MRVTNKMLSNGFLSDMRNNLENMQTLQQQMTSGKEIRKPSDDPFKVARAMQLQRDINANSQYNSNIKDVSNWMDTTDTTLNQAGNVLQRVRELLVSSGNAGYSSDEKKAIKDEINQKVSEFAQILNTNFDGSYIFGGTRGTTKPLDTSVNPATGNTELVYYKKGGGSLQDPTQAKVDLSQLQTNWAGKTITFTVDGTDTAITLDNPLPGSGTADDLIQNINNKIASNASLAGKLTSSKVIVDQNTYINFTTVAASNIAIKDPGDGTLPAELSTLNGQQIPDNQINMIKSKMSIEVSQGVKIDYNVTAGDVLEFKNSSGTTSDLRDLLKAIVNHLDGKDENGNADPTADGKLTTDDLTAITDAMNNLLRVRSEVGAKQNRMDSAQSKNEDASDNMTEILSKTEDIDITEKTMQYATMQTVYLASLQTSAKVLQPSLLDYLK